MNLLGLFGWPRREPRSEAFGDPEHSPVDKALLGAHARRLLTDPVLALAFDKADRELIATWRNTALGEIDQREAAYRQVWALGQVKAKLAAFVGDLRMMEIEQAKKEAAERRSREHRERAA